MKKKDLIIIICEYIVHIILFMSLTNPYNIDLLLGFRFYSIVNHFWSDIAIIFLLYYIFYTLYRRIKVDIVGDMWILIFVMVTFSISIFFSSNRTKSLNDVLLLMGTICYAYYMLQNYRINQIMSIALITFLLLALLSIIFVIKSPSYAIDMGEGLKASIAWKGIYITKNNFAGVMSLGCIFSIYGILDKTYANKKLSLECFILCFICLMQSNGFGSLVILIISIVIVLFINKFNIRVNIVNLMLFVHIFTYALVIIGQQYNSFFQDYFGRDLTLTGRIYIWQAIVPIVMKKPFFGFGYSTFWGFNEDYENIIRSTYRAFNFMGSHNGFLELLLQIGLVGTSIFIIMLITTGEKIKNLDADMKQSLEIKLSASYVIYILLYFITERSIFPMNYQTMFLFMSMFIINNKYREIKHTSTKEVVNFS